MSLQTKTRLGPYEIVEFIGAGGMGEVYKARDTRLDRNVAIKVAAERFIQRFSTEARVIAALNHPHICTLYDVGPNYLVMEYIEGETLSARIRRGPLTLDQALEFAIQIAGALEAAHQYGIVHRDLKPGNIMLTGSGGKLLDFGLARFRHVRGEDGGNVSMTITDSADAAGIVGTLPYMSPEQLEGADADARSDIFSFGAVLYEMVTGQRAFQKESPGGTISAISREQPKPLTNFAQNVPHNLERIILRCLQKPREERYASAADIVHELEECRSLASEPASGINFKVLLRQSKRPRVAIPILLTIALLAALLGWWIKQNFKARWARAEALPEITQLIEREKFGEAYALAVETEKYIPGDPMLDKVWPKVSWLASIRTTPPGAAVFRRNFNASNGAWELVGRSPLEKYRLPLVDSQWRFELGGFAPIERSTIYAFNRVWPSDSIFVKLDEEAKTPPGMVHQMDGISMRAKIGPLDTIPASLIGLSGFEDMPEVLLGNYWLDRYEVTNKQFKEFVDKGGYRKAEYWKHEFRKDGRALSWQEAMELFRDTTGRAGPATWAVGDYPRGREDFPVSGVSWYEAAAYAEFAGKALPTIYHWTTAAAPWASGSILPISNFGRQGPAHVGSFRGMSWSGAYDMAGNVKEWCWNETGSGKRYILGGAWDEPLYMFNDPDARSPFERSGNFGFRCAKYVSTGMAAKATEPVAPRTRDFSREKPVSDELFRAYRSLYSYDKTALNANVESISKAEEWKQEKITFAAAYGNERVIAYLFLPKTSDPPFQTVVYFPGSAVIDMRSSTPVPETQNFDFLVSPSGMVETPRL